MDYDDLLDKYSTKVEGEVEKFFQNLMEDRKKYHPFIGDTLEKSMEYTLRKGKRLGSSSTLLTYQGYKGKIDPGIKQVAAGIELYRHSILMHDDFVDKDDFRRGGRTFHLLFPEYPPDFGVGNSIFMGNILFSQCLKIILESGFNEKKLQEVGKLITSEYSDVNESQILDTYFEYIEPGKEEWYVMARKRAPSLFKVTLLAGGILAGAGEKELELLEEAAINIGFSFDIQDDIIGLFSTEEEFGRPLGNDITAGKKPLHVALTLDMAHENDIEKLRGYFGKEDLTKSDLDTVKNIVRDCGALDEAKRLSKNHASKAIEAIQATSMSEDIKSFFTDFIDYVSESLGWYK